jgi:hypothetical protein
MSTIYQTIKYHVFGDELHTQKHPKWFRFFDSAFPGGIIQLALRITILMLRNPPWINPEAIYW